MTLSQQQRIFSKNVGLLIGFAYENGFELSFGEVARTLAQQQIYFDTGRSQTMRSKHLNRLAVDFNIWYQGRLLFVNPVDYPQDVMICKKLGDYWESLDEENIWGSDWDRDDNLLEHTLKDPYHFQRS